MDNHPKLRKIHAGFAHWCPGCQEHHYIPTENPAGSINWSFDGNVDCPTFNPSVRIFRDYDVSKTAESWGRQLVKCCHYFLHAGKLTYCADTTHEFSGQTIDLPEFPE